MINSNHNNENKIDVVVQDIVNSNQINNVNDSANSNIKLNECYSSKPSIENFNDSYKPGIFEKVLNGPRGPDVRLHRYNIVVGILKLISCLFFTAGIVLLTVIVLCITINVGYVCVQIDVINSFVQMMFFVFYSNALYKITKSIWRTYLRLLHSIMESKFGSNMDDIFIKRLLGYFISKKIALMTIPEEYKSHPKDWYEKINLMVFIIFVVIILLPFPVIAIYWGYWEITGIFCLMFVGGGAITILAVNFFSRCVLYLKFFRRLDEHYYDVPSYMDINERINNQTSYLRISYCTSNRFEGGYNCLNYVLDRLIVMIAEISIASVFFGSFDPDVIKLSFMCGILLILIPFRFRMKVCRYLYKVFEKMKLLSKGHFDNIELKYRMKVHKQMKETHEKYIKDKRKSSIYKVIKENKKNKKKAGWNLKRIKAINYFNVNEDENQSNDNHADISFLYDNQNNINFNNNGNGNGNGNGNDNENDNNNNNNNNNMDGQKKKKDYEIDIKYFEEENEDGRFYTLINSKYRNIYRKALLAWDIETLTSWKGCLTVFSYRILKNVIGIGFMAFLNYYRYSNSSETETTNSLMVDIFTHLTFLIVLLGQDVIHLIPASSPLISMKVRKIFFIILLVLETILVSGMLFIIKNNYIPMAFPIIAFSNFIIYPDPRYTWDDENVERKTFFDLFKPDINLRSEISYKHIGITKGLISKIGGEKSISIENSAIMNDKYDNSGTTSSYDYSKISNETLNKDNSNAHSLNRSLSIKSREVILNTINLKSNNIDSVKRESEKKLNKVVQTIRREMQYKRNTRARYNSLAIIFSTVFVVIISILIGILVANSPLHEETPYSENVGFLKQKPAICQWRGDGISINEFSSLAYACYYNTLDDISHSLSFSRPKSSTNNFTIGENSINSHNGVHFVDFINEEKNVIVVAIRGTKTFEDLFQDVYIWSASALIQISGFFGTFIKFWPRDTIASLVNFIVKQFTNLQLLYWIDVEKHIENLKENTNYTLYLTGHSLGGGVAGVISAHLDIPAITFSSPGQIQNIECNTEQPLACHRLINTIDTLNKMCGEQSVYRYWDENAEKAIDGVPVTYELKI
ncbi:hypothetical protein PIROE2DRAFT_1077 [Piromyces sp. E2]|nr:hypothetical protein PIROE2DRAFT_1077 [Piromyces sp. E2]|eukprot:OUM70562.1 hypothetical protein PIROE2DRAFT_1077 [Piromyces sp. E2]